MLCVAITFMMNGMLLLLAVWGEALGGKPGKRKIVLCNDMLNEITLFVIFSFYPFSLITSGSCDLFVFFN